MFWGLENSDGCVDLFLFMENYYEMCRFVRGGSERFVGEEGRSRIAVVIAFFVW